MTSMVNNAHLNRLAVCAVCVLVSMWGCVRGTVQYDQTLDRKVVETIQSGQTTKQDILKWFGPPAFLAGNEGVVRLPASNPAQGELRTVDSMVFYKYFVGKHALTSHHTVYYFSNESEKIKGVSLPIPLGASFTTLPVTTGNLQFSELWILLDRQTGLVEDYVYLESEEK